MQPEVKVELNTGLKNGEIIFFRDERASSTFLNNQRKACLQRFAMAILYRIIASTSFLNWRLNRTEACLRGFALAIIVIALLHLHLVSTRIWIEGGQGCMDLLQWFSSRSIGQAKYKTSDDGNVLFCNSIFFNLDIGNSQAGQLQKRRRGLLLDDSDNL